MTADSAFTGHLVKLGLWAVASMAVGLVLRRRAAADAWHRQASLQCLLWGAINLVLALAGTRGAPPSAAFLWLNVGLDVGYAGVAVALLLTGRHFGSRALQGAGAAVLPQGLVLAALDLYYLLTRGWA